MIRKSDPIKFLRIHLEKVKPQAFSAAQMTTSQSVVCGGRGRGYVQGLAVTETNGSRC